MNHSLLVKTLRGEKTERPPVWFMRQAGRCLKAYRDLKEKNSFHKLLTTPQLAATVTLQPVEILKVDAAILFSDILVVAEALGISVSYEGKPVVSNFLKQSNGVLKPKYFSNNPLEKTYKAIEITLAQKSKNIPLIGFCGGPLTLFLYMWQGSENPKTHFEDAIKSLYNEPKKTKKIIQTITDISIEYAKKQIQTGVDVFQMFETWAGLVPETFYKDFFLSEVERFAIEIKKTSVPFIFFPRMFGSG